MKQKYGKRLLAWLLLKRLAQVLFSCKLSELDAIFTLIEEQRIAQKALLRGQHVFTLVPLSFGKSLV